MKAFFGNANLSKTRGKSFWDICKPLFSNKVNVMGEKIILVENEHIISNDRDIATIFNTYFNKITETLEIPQWESIYEPVLSDPVINAINKYANHPSIELIRQKNQVADLFEFKIITLDEIYKEILKLDSSKKVSGNIPIKILKLAVDQVAPILTTCFNSIIKDCVFPDELKLADIIPIHKKNSSTNKENYRPISLLPTISKIFERIMSNQMKEFLDTKLSVYLCGFRKGYSILNMHY